MIDSSSGMEALVFKGKHKVERQTVPLPTLQSNHDVIVRISLCGLCGSDMHQYHCRIDQDPDIDTILGHEFVGTVIEAGSDVTLMKPGTRVVSAFTTCCGTCPYCERGLTARCIDSELFGWKKNGVGLHGAQAQFIRVPHADTTLMSLHGDESDITDEEALLLGDILSTGYFAVDNTGIFIDDEMKLGKEEETGEKTKKKALAIVGIGPVGLMAVFAAKQLAKKNKNILVFAIDSIPARLELASKFGAIPIHREEVDPVHAVHDMTDGRGCDFIVEAVGFPSALRLACDIASFGAVISSCGCHSEAAVSLSTLYNKNLTLKSGRCSARHYMNILKKIIGEIRDESASSSCMMTDIITHRMPLTGNVYEMFDAKKDGCIKIVMDPWL